MSNEFIVIKLPLTKPSSKIRVKKRKDIFHQGTPVATKKEEINNDCYFEWQVSYDLSETNKKFDEFHRLTFNKIKIIDQEGKPTTRHIFELSDLLIEIIKKDFIDLANIREMLDEVQKEEKFIEDDLMVSRTYPKKYKFGKYVFLKSTIEHPLLIYEFHDLILKMEVIIKEKQRAIGIQPMLYLCVPVRLVEEYQEIKSQLAESNQAVTYLITKDNFQFITEAIKIFSILSSKHQRDIINILHTVLLFFKNYANN